MPLRKGSILIWDSRLPHGTYPNDSSNFRLIQYINMRLVDDPSVGPAKTVLELEEYDRYPPKGYEPSSLGKKLLGFAPYSDEEETGDPKKEEKEAEVVEVVDGIPAVAFAEEEEVLVD